VNIPVSGLHLVVQQYSNLSRCFWGPEYEADPSRTHMKSLERDIIAHEVDALV